MPKYIVFGDCHFRYDVPVCRKETQEEWMEFQRKQLHTIISTAIKEQATLVCTGDLYDASRVPLEVEDMVTKEILHYGVPMWLIAGNHSLQYHREANRHSSSIGMLEYFPNVVFPTATENVYGTRFEHSVQFSDEITVVHTLCFEKETPFGINACVAQDLLNKYPTKWIFTGDMHQPFIYENKERFVVNPGKMTTQSVREKDYPSQFYIVDTDTDEIFSVELDNVEVSEEHLIEREDRDARIHDAVELIKAGKQVSLSFKDNLERNVVEKAVSLEAQGIIQEIKEEQVC